MHTAAGVATLEDEPHLMCVFGQHLFMIEVRSCESDMRRHGCPEESALCTSGLSSTEIVDHYFYKTPNIINFEQ